MKVIFLDFDGVLCNHESISAGYKDRTEPEQDPYGPHADCIAALNRIIEKTGALIVVSSTWRKCVNPSTRMRDTLSRWGVIGQVVGTTPILNGDQFAYKRRGSEIQLWLDTVRTPVTSFVILDDDSDMAHLRHRLVRTTMERGLTAEDAERAIAILNAPPTDLFVDRMFREVVR
ncbi:MAG TPA: HAD domain-containing protein [Pyrinomonadaceae bacterium]